MRRRMLASAVLVVGLLGAAAPTNATSTEARSQVVGVPMPPPPPGTSPRVSQPIAAAHIDDASGSASVSSPTNTATTPPHRIEGTSDVLVEVVSADNATSESAVRAAGGTVVRSIAGLTLARMSERAAATVASAPGIHSVRPPVDVRPAQMGQGTINATLVPQLGGWQEYGNVGAGVKVGILDAFDADVLASEVAAGELDPIPAGQRFCFGYGQTCPFGTPGVEHGNAVAEVIADYAPGATLYLAEVGTTTDYLVAIDWFAANGVTIVNHSASGPFDGPGNGTGAAAAVVDYAVSKGILWVNSAGNAANTGEYPYYSGGYWRQTWADSDNDRWMNFFGTDESLGSYCGALFGLRWSDWGTGKTDYDLYISDFNASTGSSGFATRVLAGGNNQATGAAPLEGAGLPWLCNTNPAWGPVFDTNGDGFVNLWVYRHKRTSASPVGDVLEIAVNSGWLEYSVANYSAALPFADTKNPGALTVGAAIGGQAAATGYSSKGPTNDGRMKPDVIAPGCQSTMAWGNAPSGCNENVGFEGTSVAAPGVAGLAAAITLPIGAPSPASLARFIRDHAMLNFAAVPDQSVGRGIAAAPYGAPQTAPSSFHALPAPNRILDTRGGTLKGVPTAGVRPPDTLVRLKWPQIGINANPTSIVLSVAIVNATGPGYVQVLPFEWSAIGASSSLNADVAGATRANLVVVPVGWATDLGIYTQGGGHLIADVIGYFSEDVDPYDFTGGRFSDLDPIRAYDSRTCVGCSGQPRPAGAFTDVQLGDVWSPAGSANGVLAAPLITSVMVSVTVQNTSASQSFMSVVPSTTTTTPTTSNLNIAGGQTLTSTAIVRVDAATGNTARIYLSQAGHVTVDILGYFHAAAANDLRGKFVSTVPYRMIDTRQTLSSQVPSHSATSVTVGGRGGVPQTGVRGVFVNLTSTRATAIGQVQAAATSATPENHHTSLSVLAGGPAVAAATVSRVDNGSFVLRNAAPTHLIADVAGYFMTGFGLPSSDARLSRFTLPTIDGKAPNNSVLDATISSDGNLVAFSSWASNLFVGDTNGRPDAFVLNRSSGSLTRLPIDGGGLLLGEIVIAKDGGSVAFITNQPGLVPGDSNNKNDLYRYDLTTQQFTVVNVNEAGALASTFGVVSFSMSGDGSKFVFVTRDSLLTTDTDAKDDAYYRDVTAATTVDLTSAYQIIGYIGAKITVDGSTIWVSMETSPPVTLRYYTASGSTAAFVDKFLMGPASPFGSTMLSLGTSAADGGVGVIGVLDPATGIVAGSGQAWPWYSGIVGATADDSVRVVRVQVANNQSLFVVNTSTQANANLGATYDGVQLPNFIIDADVAADGELVLFTGPAQLLPGPYDPSGLYLYDLSTV